MQLISLIFYCREFTRLLVIFCNDSIYRLEIASHLNCNWYTNKNGAAHEHQRTRNLLILTLSHNNTQAFVLYVITLKITIKLLQNKLIIIENY